MHCACGLSSNGRQNIARQPPGVIRKHQLPPGWSGSCKKRWFRSSNLINDTIALFPRIPDDITRVVGVPRSGMIPAGLIATHLHLPLWSISNGRLTPLDSGDRMNGYRAREGRTLLVEDSVGEGRRMQKLAAICDLATFCKLAIYVLPRSKHLVDLFAREVPAPHLFEWNLFNGWFMRAAALDMDGIICCDGSDQPLYVPRNIACRAIITARPESERAKTVAWLGKYQAKYDELIMWPGDPADRDLHTQAEYKAAAITKTGADIYIESCRFLSHELRKRGHRVLCPQEGILQ